MKAKHIKIALSLAVAAGVIIYIANRRKKNQAAIENINKILEGAVPDPSKPKGSGQVIVPDADINKLPVGRFPLKVGDKNRKVYDLQKIMNQVYNANLDLDGRFGQGMYSVLCSKYWSLCGSSFGYYGREISQSDFDEIRATR
jgi:hypothetical protein